MIQRAQMTEPSMLWHVLPVIGHVAIKVPIEPSSDSFGSDRGITFASTDILSVENNGEISFAGQGGDYRLRKASFVFDITY
jgi:hypothetical protein